MVCVGSRHALHQQQVSGPEHADSDNTNRNGSDHKQGARTVLDEIANYFLVGRPNLFDWEFDESVGHSFYSRFFFGILITASHP